MRAIDTRYAGRLFRSRLEARYAVLFDHLGIQWDYEPEGFVLDDGTRYLPDFQITPKTDGARSIWVEVKPTTPTVDEAKKLGGLGRESECPALFLAGPPSSVRVYHYSPERSEWSEMAMGMVDFCAMVGDMNAVVDGRLAGAVERALSARFEFGASRRGAQA